MHIFFCTFHQGGKYITKIASHQAELIKEGKFTDQISSYISSLNTDYLNLDSSSDYGRNNERKKLVQTKCIFCGGTNHSTEMF